MSETTPPATPVSPTKSLLLSKTIWLQVITILLGFYPPALAWLKSSPGDVVTLIVTANILLRFFTHDRIALFPPEDVEKPSGPAGGLNNPLWIAGLGMTAAALGMGLPSCTPAQIEAARAVPITGTLSYRDPKSGAKAGLSYSPARKLRGAVTVPIYDAQTGVRLGVTDVVIGDK